MNKFFIARHGTTENNLDRRLSGWAETPLASTGLLPTEIVISKLASQRIDAIYTSDLSRASITAEFIAQGLNFQKKIVKLSGLREVDYGDATNMLTTEAYERYPLLDRDTHFVPLNGESLDQMQQRVFATIEKVNATHTDENILLVCHSGVMAALKASHIGQDLGEHNISQAYAHDFVGKFYFTDGAVTSFEAFEG